MNELKNKPQGPPMRRRSARIQENLIKRNSKEFQLSAFVSGPPPTEKPNHLTAGKFDTSIGPSTLYDIPKQDAVEANTPFKQGIFGDEKREDIFTDNECNSLKIPSLVDFNMSNLSKDNGKVFGEDRFSNSPLSYKKANLGFGDNLTDNEMNEALENMKNRRPRRKNSISEYVNLKRFSTNSFIRNHPRTRNQAQNEPGLSRETSNGNRERGSIRMQFGNMKNEDQLKFIRSLNLPGLANYESDFKNQGMSTITKTEDKLDDVNDLTNNKAPSVVPLEEANLQQFDKINNLGLIQDCNFSWLNGTLNGTRNASKRNSVISNLSLYLHRDENKDDN